MFRIEPAPEFGRNDVGKLGWCTVEVYDDHITTRFFRSNGSLLYEDGTSSSVLPKIHTFHSKEDPNTLVGVHLRHPWAEVVELPYNGPLDEFRRKRVRNDYTILGLWECGIRDLRVPISDLVDKRIRNRMEMLANRGHRFTIFSFGIPSQTEINLLHLNSFFIEALEIILPWNDVEKLLDDLQTLHTTLSVPLFLAKIASSAHQIKNGSKFIHYVSSGFRVGRSNDEEFLDSFKRKNYIDGFVFEVGQEESPLKSIMKIERCIKNRGVEAIANVRLASENPAEFLSDDINVANRVAETLIASFMTYNVRVFLDTFMDLDRGYFPRIGLYDRRYNRRIGSFVLANLQGVLRNRGIDTSFIESIDESNGRVLVFEKGKMTMNLFLPKPGMIYDQRSVYTSKIPRYRAGKVKSLDLLSGTISRVNWTKKYDDLILDTPISSKTPFLSILDT
jgi:hypothetical protein